MYARDTALIATPNGSIRITGDEAQIESILIEPGDIAPMAPPATSRGADLRDGMFAIPFGITTCYGAITHAVTSSPRPIGQACARNPFPIAYSAGDEPATKQWVLDHECRHSRGQS